MSNVQTNIPARFGEFEIQEKIGQGGICEVYRAVQPSLERQVAIKILRRHHLSDPGLRRRFIQEAQIIAQLSHPNIIHVIDAGIDGENVWYAMEFVEGTDFKQILVSGQASLNVKMSIIQQTLHGLIFAHENGIIHRDLKPANIMVDKKGIARLTDFGIAHLIANAADPDSTKTGELMGTPAYMAPEQKESAKNISSRSDIFSMGVILYEALTGRKPVGRVLKPSEINSGVPEALDEIVLSCLEHDPGLRPQSAEQLLKMLKSNSPGASSTAGNKVEPMAKVDGFVGRCKFLDTLKESAMGGTYLVENTADNQLYIIKKITGRGIEVGWLRRLAALDHDHILNVHGAGSDVKKVVIVSDYARGGSLADRMGRAWNEDEVARLMYEAGSALDFAHKNDVLHGNLRPENILFGRNGSVLLTDFGLAPLSGKRRPWWRAPENETSREADLFTLGAIGYRLLYRDRPRWFSEGDVHFPKSDQFISRDLRHLLAALLHQDPVKRLSSAEEVMRRLRPPSPESSQLKTTETRPQEQRTPLWIWVTLSIISLGVGVLIALFSR